MKNFKLITLLAVLVMTATYFSCGPKDTETAAQARTKMLTDKVGGWEAVNVTVPAGTASEWPTDWDGFKVSVSSTNMSTTHVDAKFTPVWPSGTWKFTNDEGTMIERGDGVMMTVIALTETQFKVSFNIPEGTETARVAALDGQYVFTLE